MKSYKDKKLLLSLLFLGLFAGVTGRLFEFGHAVSLPQTTNINAASALLATEQNLEPTTPTPPSITLGFAGNIVLSGSVAKKVSENLNGDYSQLFTNAGFLKTPDMTFASLAGPLSDGSATAPSSYTMDPSVVPALKNAGIDVVSFTDSHVFDNGPAAFEDSLFTLHAGGILTCGAGMTKSEAEEPAILSKDGFTVGYLCFSDIDTATRATGSGSGILLASDPDFDAIVKSAAQKANALVVSFNFGAEGGTLYTDRQEQLAKEAIDDGAAIVTGVHPHAAEVIGSYNSAPIFYSLGDFISDYAFPSGTSGIFATTTLTGKTTTDVASQAVALDTNFAPHLAK